MLINGVDISTLDEDGLAALRNQDVGFIFQAHYLLDEFTCLENALTPITIRDGEAAPGLILCAAVGSAPKRVRRLSDLP